MPRISEDLKQKLIDFKKSKGNNPTTNYDIQKKAFFDTIITLIENDQLTLKTLIDTLATFQSNSARLFHKSGLWGGGPSLESQTAKHVAALFRALGCSLTENALKRIINGEVNTIKNSLEKHNLARIIDRWQLRPYDTLAHQRVEHELKGYLNLNSFANKNYSITETLYQYHQGSFSKDNSDCQYLIKHLLILQDLDLPFFSEIVFEISQKFAVNANYIQAISKYINENDDNNPDKQALQKILINAHPNIAVAAVLAGEDASHFYKLDVAMQRQVQQQLFIEARGSNNAPAKQRLEQITDAAAIKLKTIEGAEKNTALIAEAVKVIPHEKAKQFHKRLKQKALALIDTYLATNPNSKKKTFFTALQTQINEQGISLGQLKTLLNNETHDIFYKSVGRNENSGAANCMAALYFLATGKKLSEKELSTLVRKKEFPDNPDLVLECYCTNMVNGGPRPFDKDVEATLAHAIAEVKSLQHIATRTTTEQRLIAEAQYQQFLIQKGLKQVANLNPEARRFDPQGHIIVEVTLEDNEYQDLYHLVKSEDTPVDNNNISSEEAKKFLVPLLNIDPTKPTYCNLDVKGHALLEKAYKTWAKTGTEDNENLNKAVDALAASPSRSSVIALQEEMEMHMRLSSRVLQKVIPDTEITTDMWTNIHNQAASAINKKVQAEFQKALLTSYNPINDPPIDFSNLNRLLDEARALLASTCKNELIAACKTELSVEEFKEVYDKYIAKITKELFEQTTATGLAYLRTDADNHSVSRISATDKTAHDKKLGEDEQAHRSSHHNVYHMSDADKITVTPNSVTRAQARVPSLAYNNFASLSNNHRDSVRDVVKKLDWDYSALQKQSGGYDGPMTYNLLTSLHSKLWDRTIDNSNRQRASAARIQKGAHLFNRKQVLAGKPNSLCYVQNIAVNQHSNNLSYDGGLWGDAATAEATLMSEIAMLSNFFQHAYFLPPAIREKVIHEYHKIHAEYVDFLKNNQQSSIYFKDSDQGKEVIETLKTFKTYMVNNTGGLKALETDTLGELAGKALIKIMATNQHWDNQFGMLVQSFSVLTASVSQTGCKSANERLQLMAGRVDYLSSLQDKPEDKRQPTEITLYATFKNYVNNENNIGVAQLQKALDCAFNEHNVYGVATQYSEEDQGAPAKTQKSTHQNSGKLGFTEVNTNIAESAFVRFFNQKNAKPLQPHKGNHAKQLKDALFLNPLASV